MIRFDLSNLVGADRGESLPLKVEISAPKLADLAKLRNLKAEGEVKKLDTGYLAEGKLAAELGLECARCLKAFTQKVEAKFSDEFAQNPTDDQFGFDGDTLNLGPMLRAAVLIQIPVRPLHDPKCKGLCQVCGKDLNQEPHKHKQTKPPGPFDQLKKLR